MTEKARILITRSLPEAVMARARRDYEVVTPGGDAVLDAEALIKQADGCAGILCCISERFPAALISRLPSSVRIISTFSVGTDHIDLASAKARGIRVGNTPDAVTVATAEIAMLLMLGAARRAHEGQRLLYDRQWRGFHPTQLLGVRLNGKRLGIFGMGKIGQAVARRARAFDMDVHYCSRNRLAPEKEQGAIFHETPEALFAVSDVLSLHAPSTPETRHILNAAAIDKLPQGAIVINTARGDLVVDDDLIAALRSGRVAYAGLDVYQGEPDIHPGYYELPNVFLLPHMGTSAIEARNEMGFAALDNIDAVLAGREPPNPVA